jgi:hypothetical protein
MRRNVLLTGIIVLFATISVLAIIFIPRPIKKAQIGTPTLDARLPKKLIEYGWDAPSPAFVAANIRTMEQRPFDGIVVCLSVGPRVFTHTAYADADFAQDSKDLKATAFHRFTDNFLIVWASSEQGWNWLNDSDWAAAEQNIRNFARSAAAGNFKGIFFDSETYGPNTWAYDTTLYPNKTFEQVQAVVRQRGARFMNILQGELPSARVLITWFMGKIQDDFEATGGKIAQGGTPLLSAFVEGMFSVAAGDVKLIDGNEYSYHYTDANAFDQSRTRLHDSINRLGAEYQNAARAHYQIGQALYADETLNLLNSPRTIGFYIDSQRGRLLLLEHNIYHALRTSDQYVWFYSEHMNWWNNSDIPDRLEDAIRRAQALQESGQSPVYDMRVVAEANQRRAQAITVSGQIVSNDGKPIKQARMKSGFYNKSGSETACYTLPNNHFDCLLPRGWSGTLTPALDGYRFDPPVFSTKNLTEGQHLIFTAIPLNAK